MASFAKLDENNNVISVHIINDDILIINGNKSEQAGIDFLTELHGYSLWKQTYEDGSIRKNYSAIGFKYDFERDAFIPPKPFESWSLDENTCRWNSPTPYPSDGNIYFWSEEDQNWK